jgi:hypothetical protein
VRVLTRAGGEAGLFPEFFPVPDAGSGVEKAVAELVGEQQDLAAVMRFVREHIGKHGAAGGPGLCPTATREFLDAAVRGGRESVGQHAQALRGAFFVRGGGLADCATVVIERCGTLQVWRGIFQPHEATIVEMRKDGGDWAATSFFAGRLSAPGSGVEVGKNELVHRVVCGVGFKEGVANLGEGALGLRRWEGAPNFAGSPI